MLLRIIIPVHNGEKIVGTTIAHLLKQVEGRAGISLLIIPNACKDNTVAVVEKFKSNGRVEICLSDIASKMAAMNLGTKLSKSYKYIAFMDDDSLVNFEDIQAGFTSLENEKSLHVVALQPKGMVNSSSLIKRFWQKVFAQSTENRFLKFPKRYMVGRFMLFRASAWEDIPEHIIHDDAWLTRVHLPNIKILTGNYVYYTPSSDPKEWWLRYKRNIASLEQMKKLFPSEKIKYFLKPQTNWLALVNPLNFPESFFFAFYRVIRKMNKLYYKNQIKKSTYQHQWHRDKTTHASI